MGEVGRLGAVPVGDGLVEFRFWAPDAKRVTVDFGELEREDGGIFAARLPARHGDRYRFSLDGGKPLADPFSRWPPEGPRRARSDAGSARAWAALRRSSTRAGSRRARSRSRCRFPDS